MVTHETSTSAQVLSELSPIPTVPQQVIAGEFVLLGILFALVVKDLIALVRSRQVRSAIDKSQAVLDETEKLSQQNHQDSEAILVELRKLIERIER